MSQSPYKIHENDMNTRFGNFVLDSLISTKIETGAIRQHINSSIDSEIGVHSTEMGGANDIYLRNKTVC